jgi:signal peptidase I
MTATAITGSATAGRSRSRQLPLGMSRREVAGWALVYFVSFWMVIFRPTTLGGEVSYLLVSGTSMEPSLHSGDLAVLVPVRAYVIGDVVAYHPRSSRSATIIHRIVGGDADSGFVMQGDNRQAQDIDRPKPADLLGRAILIVPRAAPVIAILRHPLVLGSFAALLAMALALRYLPVFRPKQT